jgi:aryl-alcohol dehydrogenase-like predicted oxidoreductase
MDQPGGDPNKLGNSRRWIIQEVENSLRRLDTDWIDWPSATGWVSCHGARWATDG